MNNNENREREGVSINVKEKPKGIDIKKKAIVIGVTLVVALVLVAVTLNNNKNKEEKVKSENESINESLLKDEKMKEGDALDLESEYGETLDKRKSEIILAKNERRLSDGKIQLADGTVITEEQYLQLKGILDERQKQQVNSNENGFSDEYIQQRVITENSSDYYSYDKEKKYEMISEKARIEQELENKRKEEVIKSLESARTSGIGFGSKKESSNNGNDMTALLTELAKGGSGVDIGELAKLGQTASDYDVANGQGNKKSFQNSNTKSNWYLNGDLEKVVSRYEVKTGAIIPATLVSGINSDLPGNVTALVRENVYDSVNGKYLVIPKGSKLFGVYDSAITFGQVRAMVLWSRLILPNGKSIDLEQMNGVDLSGMSGLKDKVNNHFGQLLKGVLLSSLIGAGSSSLPDTNTALNGAQNGAVEATVEITSKFAEKVLNIQPTITISPGKKFNVFVHKDMILEPYNN